MTDTEAMSQFDRLFAAGYAALPQDRIPGAYREFLGVVGSAPLATVDRALTRLIRARTSGFWPTPGEIREALHAEQASTPKTDTKCHVCHGSGWVEAPPYRANGGHVYEGVVRCSACGSPAPKIDHLAGTQTPLTGAELRAWADRAASVPISLPELLANIEAMKGRIKPMPAPRRRAFREE